MKSFNAMKKTDISGNDVPPRVSVKIDCLSNEM